MDIPMKCPFLVPVPNFQTHPYAVAMMKHDQKKSWLEATKMRGVFRQRPGDAQYQPWRMTN